MTVSAEILAAKALSGATTCMLLTLQTWCSTDPSFEFNTYKG